MSIVLEKLTKRFGTLTVVKAVSLEIAEGELFVLLGASGSGKSTILRIIAGLTTCDTGRVLVNGRDVTPLAPQARGTGFVFQNYSIFRHMTVAENVEFGLKIRKVPSAERTKRGEELLELVGLTGLGDRYAHQISGGQQQRVALARALAYEPSVLLLDEPLGALDVKIRVQLRRSLKEIQRRLRVTTLLVTHDQEEAYELGDRIGVMERGTLLEVGVPEQLYARPRTLHVASFLGGGTVLAGRAVNGNARFGPINLPIPEDRPHEEGASVELLFRPEQVVLSQQEPASDAIILGQGDLIEQTFSGAMRRVRLRVPRLPGTRQVAPTVGFGEVGLVLEATIPAGSTSADTALWASLRSYTILEQAPSRLLVVDPGSRGGPELDFARMLAARMGASIMVLRFNTDTSVADLRGPIPGQVDSGGSREIETRAASGDLAEQITAQCANALFELVIIPRQLGSTKRSLDPRVISFLERADIPVIVAPFKLPPAISRVLICTRAGEPGKSDIRIGGRLARHLGARVSLLHIVQTGAEPAPWVRRHLKAASATLSTMEVSNEVLNCENKNPAAGILREAAEHDLLVIGGHGPQARSVFARDDIALRVLASAGCPALVVPAAE